MPKFFTPRISRVTVGLGVLAAFAAAPVGSEAADTAATGTLSAGSLTNTAPAITAFTANLSGVTQTVGTAVGTWRVTDARASDAGYNVTASASAPRVDNVIANAGTGTSLVLTPRAATPVAGNPAPTAPVASGPQELVGTTATIVHADAGTGQGPWDFAADSGNEKSLAVVIPGDAEAGAYSSTLTFTASPLVP